MIFNRIDPDPVLERFIECLWIIQDNDSTPRPQKIIPDGFTEIIFHFGESYEIKLEQTWTLQSKYLLAGQIDKHFMLKNTGPVSMLGLKFKPTGLTHLFDLNMEKFTNVTMAIKEVIPLVNSVKHLTNPHDVVEVANNFLKSMVCQKSTLQTAIDKAVDGIFKNHGMVSIADLAKTAGIGERQMEYLFKKFVGLSPKRFAQIIRFNYIFSLVENHQGWSDLAYEAAYYDQSHFIRNFKNFTGENPADYAFHEKNMANFFLKKEAR